MWSLEDGEPLLKDAELKFRASACALMHDRERAVLAGFEDNMIGQGRYCYKN